MNKGDFLTLLDSRVTLFNYERELYLSQAEYMMKLAQLEAVIGTDLVSMPVVPMTSPSDVMREQPQTPAPAPEPAHHQQQ